MKSEIITREEGAMQKEQRLAIIESRIRDDMNRAAESAIDIGRCLNQAKDEGLVPHGKWQEWVRQHTGMSPRAAQYVMKAAREIPNTSTLAGLEFSKVQALLTLPPEDRETFAEEVGADQMSVRELKEAIKAREKAECERDEERETRKELEGTVCTLRRELKEAKGINKDRAEIERLKAEIEEQEEEIAHRAAAEKKAKDDLLNLRAQIARGNVSASGSESGMTPDELGEAARAFIGRASVLPHMASELATCDHKTRSAYRAYVDMICDWCDRAKRALDTVSGEVIDV